MRATGSPGRAASSNISRAAPAVRAADGEQRAPAGMMQRASSTPRAHPERAASSAGNIDAAMNGTLQSSQFTTSRSLPRAYSMAGRERSASGAGSTSANGGPAALRTQSDPRPMLDNPLCRRGFFDHDSLERMAKEGNERAADLRACGVAGVAAHPGKAHTHAMGGGGLERGMGAMGGGGVERGMCAAVSVALQVPLLAVHHTLLRCGPQQLLHLTGMWQPAPHQLQLLRGAHAGSGPRRPPFPCTAPAPLTIPPSCLAPPLPEPAEEIDKIERSGCSASGLAPPGAGRGAAPPSRSLSLPLWRGMSGTFERSSASSSGGEAGGGAPSQPRRSLSLSLPQWRGAQQ